MTSLIDTSQVREAATAFFGGVPEEERIARLIWTVVTEPGDGVAGALVREFGAVHALAWVQEEERDGGAALRSPDRRLVDARARWRPRCGPSGMVAALDAGRRAGLRFVIPGDPSWPRPLDDLGVHAPHGLWVRGTPEALADVARGAAIVGARASTGYGESIAGEIAGGLAATGVTVVSGAAYGIDAVAHRAALAVDGGTVAVVAGGVDRVYPAGHAHLFAEIARAGAVMGETPPGTTPTKWRFLARNRLIAAATRATIVVEAGARSGTLNTAGHAASIGRPLGAVPGPVTSPASAGCHRLLREYDAQCITSLSEARELLGIASEEAEPSPEAMTRDDSEQLRVRDALSPRTPRRIDDIARRSGLSVSSVESALGLLELGGRVARSAEGWVLA